MPQLRLGTVKLINILKINKKFFVINMAL